MTANVSKNDSDSDASEFDWQKILWKRTKRPFVFIATCLVAAFVLLWLQGLKTDFDKNQVAPLIIVDEKKGTKFLREGTAEDLISKVEANDPLIRRIVNDTKYQTFKNEDDLITGLFTSLTLIKEKKLRSLEENNKLAFEARNNIAIQKNSVKTALQNYRDRLPKTDEPKKSDDNTQNLSKYFPSEIRAMNDPLRSAKGSNQISEYDVLETILSKLPVDAANPKSYSIDELKNKIDIFFKEKEKDAQDKIEGIAAEIGTAATVYEPYYKNIYASLKNKENIRKTFTPDDSNAVSKNIFDSKNNLSVVYKVIEITLVIVIVFGLLYVLLVPLKHIFFITTSADTLTEQTKKLFERKESVATGSTIGKSIILTATTIGLGAAVLAGTTFTGNAAGNNSDTAADAPEIAKSNFKPAMPKPPFGGTKLTEENNIYLETKQIELNNLTTSINNLKEQVIGLQDIVREANLDGIPDTINRIDSNLANINTAVSKYNYDDNQPTLLGRVNDFSQKLEGKDQTLASNIKTFFGEKFGDVSQPDTLLGQLSETNKSLGKFSNLSNEIKQTAPNSNPPDLMTAMGVMWKALGTDQYISNINSLGTNPTARDRQTSTLFGSAKFIDGSIGNLSDRGKNTIFGSLFNVNDTLGERDPREPNVWKRLQAVDQNIGTKDPTGKNLYEYTKFVSQNTTDIGRNILGNEGNIFKRFKTLFTENQYLINYFTIAELRTQNNPVNSKLTKIIDSMETLIKASDNNMKPISADDLFEKLNDPSDVDLLQIQRKVAKYNSYGLPAIREDIRIDKEDWKKNKDFILRVSRIARY